MVSRAIEQAQTKVEGFNFDMRKRVVEYDDVMNKQREIIYKKRQEILQAADQANGELKKEIQEKMLAEVDNLIALYAPEGISQIEYEQIIPGFCEILPFDTNSQGRLKSQLKKIKEPGKIKDLLDKLVVDAYEAREKQVGAEAMRQIERFVYLRTTDRLWVDHLDAMDDLREGVSLRGYGQKDPLVEYKKEAFASFERLLGSVDHDVVRQVFRVQIGQPRPQPQPVQTNIDAQDGMGLTPQPQAAKQAIPRKKKVGRNDPCPCGSNKKYKKCCYPKYG